MSADDRKTGRWVPPIELDTVLAVAGDKLQSNKKRPFVRADQHS